MRKTFKEIQDEVIEKYRITINEHSDCYSRVHAHIRSRMVCKWKRANSVQSTFTLLHEVGHIVANNSTMRRAEQEYYATAWALRRCNEYAIDVPDNILNLYQSYILMEVARGMRRGGKGYDLESLNIYTVLGVDKTIEEFKEELTPVWRDAINGWRKEEALCL
jgi:hypothetical protein